MPEVVSCVLQGSEDCTIVVWRLARDRATARARVVLRGHLEPITCLDVNCDLVRETFVLNFAAQSSENCRQGSAHNDVARSALLTFGPLFLQNTRHRESPYLLQWTS